VSQTPSTANKRERAASRKRGLSLVTWMLMSVQTDASRIRALWLVGVGIPSLALRASRHIGTFCASNRASIHTIQTRNECSYVFASWNTTNVNAITTLAVQHVSVSERALMFLQDAFFFKCAIISCTKATQALGLFWKSFWKSKVKWHTLFFSKF